MVWISSSDPNAVGIGTPTLGVSSIGDTAVLEIRVTATSEGVNAVSVAYGYSASEIETIGGLSDVEVCPAGLGNEFGPGNCGSRATGVGGFASLLTPHPGLTTAGNGTTSAGALTLPPNGQTAGTFALAHITFTVVGCCTTGTGFYRPGLDGIVALDGTFSTPPITSGSIGATIPEPGTIALLAPGLAALALARGRPRGGEARATPLRSARCARP